MEAATYKIRLGTERRELWDKAAAESRRTLADFIKATVDAEAEKLLRRSSGGR